MVTGCIMLSATIHAPKHASAIGNKLAFDSMSCVPRASTALRANDAFWANSTDVYACSRCISSATHVLATIPARPTSNNSHAHRCKKLAPSTAARRLGAEAARRIARDAPSTKSQPDSATSMYASLEARLATASRPFAASSRTRITHLRTQESSSQCSLCLLAQKRQTRSNRSTARRRAPRANEPPCFQSPKGTIENAVLNPTALRFSQRGAKYHSATAADVTKDESAVTKQFPQK
mmetsp:Transcript_123466/g.348915  ORF Transcript_123466/g.348915 Transcript_123466/m.348915 type:complete len:236 (+) Transcript_123466:264-971(+)